MNHEDPISQFFPGEEDVDLYDVLGTLPELATVAEIKKSYRKLALVYHPDKHHASMSELDKAAASLKFQQVGFAYAVLSDEKRRARYDATGKTDEGFDLSAGEDGWEAYFEAMFDRVTRGKLDDMKEEYQGSEEEIRDLKKAYQECEGSIEDIMTHIPHSTTDDEPRFVIILSKLITAKDVPSFAAWETSAHDEKARLVRKKQAGKEAKEAEKLAQELGVWDEFYGSGKASEKKKKRGKGKSNQEEGHAEEEEDHSALQALILKKRQNTDSFYDGLAAKYSQPSKNKGKKRTSQDDEEGEPPRKKAKRSPTPELDDAAFEALQNSLFGGKVELSAAPAIKTKACSNSKRKSKK